MASVAPRGMKILQEAQTLEDRAWNQAIDSLDTRKPITMPRSRKAGAGSLEFKRLADVPRETVHWLWDGRLAYGKLNVIFGRKGDGKSFATLAVAKAITGAERLPDDLRAAPPPPPADVLFIVFEDGLGDTLRPRMEDLGIDLKRVHVLSAAKNDRGEDTTFGPDYIPKIEEYLTANEAIKLVVIDPVMAILSGVDVHRDNEVRSALQPLVEIAQRRNVAVVVVAHTRKNKGGHALDALEGSVAFVNLARSVLFVGRDPNDDGRRIMTRVAGNLAADTSGVAFRITPHEADKTRAVFAWEGTTDVEAWEMLDATNPKRSTKIASAMEWLKERLADGPVLQSIIQAEGDPRGFTAKTLAEARKRIGGKSEKSPAFGGPWEWSM